MGKKRPRKPVIQLSSDDESIGTSDEQPSQRSRGPAPSSPSSQNDETVDVIGDTDPFRTADCFTESKPERGGGPRVRSWCCTAWRADMDAAAVRLRLIGGSLGLKYFCFQQEIAPTTGREHYQAYFHFENPQRLNGLRKWMTSVFGPQVACNFRPAHGTDMQNRTYCSKEDTSIPNTFNEYGEISKQGKRSDLDTVAEMVQQGASVRDIAIACPTQFIKFSKGIKELHALTTGVHRDPSVPIRVYWWFGPSGVGKSRAAYEKYPTAYRKMMGNHWWDGYQGENVVVFDDYRASMCKFHLLLTWLDRYPVSVEAKGTSFPLSATVFVITTVQRPEVMWHKQTEENLFQLIRRCTDIVEFTPEGEQIVRKSDDVVYDQLTPTEVQEKYYPESTFHA